ncbi:MULTISPECIES: ROK family glucokinase [Pseudobutyrivibrio]|jgi:glucokinase|uniref:Glucokinase n=1 Tax=Pseudobutyrivibrio ruminis TaxID=46206 RepID=A0A2G3DSY9_9FIRM|nr:MULTISPECIES: ROK family glucokinase [Pseudobutyrivibrio]MBE5904478.1 ROK family glucokinase [Pseudobutyrivibrio sp.]PHU34003.1 glucokinase [Pseudobutyrivibrio ruminis]SCY46384.1 glucokinase [Pseudobutyrivibrio sp. AR14]
MAKYGFGLDLGGTTCKCGLFTNEGELLDKWEVPTDTSNGGVNILKNLAATVKEKMAEKNISADDVSGVGIGIPGPVSGDGVVNRCVNLGWGVFNVEKEFSDELGGIKVKAGNDANVAALGEAWMGAAKEYSSSVMVTLGTGVGGGVIINDEIITGAAGAAGEIGHIRVNYTEEMTCGCGNHGCLEQYCSATGIARLAKIRLAMNEDESGLRAIPTENIDAKAVFDEAKKGDVVAKEVVKRACEYLAQGLQVISAVVNPEAFVIGGGVSKAGQILIDEVEYRFNQIAFHGCRNTKIILATLGNDAGIYGAMKLIL